SRTELWRGTEDNAWHTPVADYLLHLSPLWPRRHKLKGSSWPLSGSDKIEIMRGLDRCGTTLNEYMSSAIFLWAEEDEKEPTLHIFSSGLKLCLSQRGAHHRRIRCCMRVNQW